MAVPIASIDVGMTARLGRALSVEFRKRNSSFWGGDYFYSGETIGEEIYVFRNVDVVEDAAEYVEFPKDYWIVRIDKTNRSLAELQAKVEAVLGVSVQSFVPRGS
jgi:uncharacterized protein (UPF0128 family)